MTGAIFAGIAAIGIIMIVADDDYTEYAAPFVTLPWLISAIAAPISAKSINRRNGLAQVELGGEATLGFAPTVGVYNMPLAASMSRQVTPGLGVTLSF